MTGPNRDRYAREIMRAGQDLGIAPRGIVIAFATTSVESDWWMWSNHKVPESLRLPHEKVGSDGMSVGLFQQQIRKGDGGRWWWADCATCMDPYKSALLFFERLAQLDYRAATTNQRAGELAQEVQKSAYPDRYAGRMNESQALYDRLAGGLSVVNPPKSEIGGSMPAPTGDPTWLPEALRAAGLQCDIFPGAMNRGHGDFGQITHVIVHHTGSNNASAGSIAQHPDLGLASQLHLDRDGKFTLCGVGIAWHAGQGAWPGIPTNNANQVTIGIEAANDGGGAPGKPHRSSWPEVQYQAYATGVAAILNKLGLPADRCIAHKEWAGPAQGKWDPGSLDMQIFRADVAREQARLKGGAPVATTPKLDAQALAGLTLDQLAGPGTAAGANFPGWAQLGGMTVVDALAHITREQAEQGRLVRALCAKAGVQ